MKIIVLLLFILLIVSCTEIKEPSTNIIDKTETESISDDPCDQLNDCTPLILSHRYYDEISDNRKVIFLSKNLSPEIIWDKLLSINPKIIDNFIENNLSTDEANPLAWTQLNFAFISYYYVENKYLDQIYIDLTTKNLEKNLTLVKDLLFILNEEKSIDQKKLESFLASLESNDSDQDNHSFISKKISFDKINIYGFQVIQTKQIRLMMFRTK